MHLNFMYFRQKINFKSALEIFTPVSAAIVPGPTSGQLDFKPTTTTNPVSGHLRTALNVI